MSTSKREVGLYMEHAQKMLEVAAHNIAGGFFGSAINRSYYAVFYAANALLATRGLHAVSIQVWSLPFGSISSNQA